MKYKLNKKHVQICLEYINKVFLNKNYSNARFDDAVVVFSCQFQNIIFNYFKYIYPLQDKYLASLKRP